MGFTIALIVQSLEGSTIALAIHSLDPTKALPKSSEAYKLESPEPYWELLRSI